MEQVDGLGIAASHTRGATDTGFSTVTQAAQLSTGEQALNAQYLGAARTREVKREIG